MEKAQTGAGHDTIHRHARLGAVGLERVAVGMKLEGPPQGILHGDALTEATQERKAKHASPMRMLVKFEEPFGFH